MVKGTFLKSRHQRAFSQKCDQEMSYSVIGSSGGTIVDLPAGPMIQRSLPRQRIVPEHAVRRRTTVRRRAWISD
jgi:hypothetical protein